MMKHSITLIALCLSVVCAQASKPASTWLKHITEYNDTLFGVKTMVPAGFLVCEGWKNAISYTPNQSWKSCGESPSGSSYLYSNAMISRDAESMLLLPYLLFAKGDKAVADRSAFDLCRKQYGNERNMAICCQTGGAEPASNLEALGGVEAQAWGNADSVYIADLPVSTPCVKRFTHCVGIYMAKSQHVPIYIKLLLTDKGYAQRSQILGRIKGCMTYASYPQPSNDELTSATNAVFNVGNVEVRSLLHDGSVR